MSKTKKMAKKTTNPLLTEKVVKASSDEDRVWIWKRLHDACLFEVFPVEWKLALAFELLRSTGNRVEVIPAKTKLP